MLKWEQLNNSWDLFVLTSHGWQFIGSFTFEQKRLLDLGLMSRSPLEVRIRGNQWAEFTISKQ